jgi:predicted DNA-binding transcriptional regulator AlpA
MDQNRLLRPREAADFLGVAGRSLERWRASGDGPAFVRVGPRRVGYRMADLQAWTTRRTFEHRAAEAMACSMGSSR